MLHVRSQPFFAALHHAVILGALRSGLAFDSAAVNHILHSLDARAEDCFGWKRQLLPFPETVA
jgi:hypothetical protein